MPEGDLEHSRLQDALSSVTRKERQFLLCISLFGITLVKTGLVPSRISGLGIEFRTTDQQALLSIVALVIGYFLVAFICYAASDYLAWKLLTGKQAMAKNVTGYEEDLIGYFPPPGSLEEEIENYKDKMYEKIRIYFKLIAPISIFRVFFDFGLPIVFGCYALFVLIRAVS